MTSESPNRSEDCGQPMATSWAEASVQIELIERILGRGNDFSWCASAEVVGKESDQTANDVRIRVGSECALTVGEVADHPNARSAAGHAVFG